MTTKTKEPIIVELRETGNCWTALCCELDSAGMGVSPMEAMKAVGMSIQSTLLGMGKYEADMTTPTKNREVK